MLSWVVCISLIYNAWPKVGSQGRKDGMKEGRETRKEGTWERRRKNMLIKLEDCLFIKGRFGLRKRVDKWVDG